MIILYNFSNAHFAISCTGLKDCSFTFGFNTNEHTLKVLGSSPEGNEYHLPPIIHPFLDLNHYALGKALSHRIGIPSVEDGNPYGPSESAIYHWLFFGEKSYATILPVGPASLIDFFYHLPGKLRRASEARPIEKWYSPPGLGIFPLIDSAHCLDMVRWMLRVAFWNRDHAENLRVAGLPEPTPLDYERPDSVYTPLLEPRNSMKANHLMRMCYWHASGPGFNTLTTFFAFISTANWLRQNVIEANRAAGYQCVDGSVIEAPGAGVYAQHFGKTHEEKRACMRTEDSAGSAAESSAGSAEMGETFQNPLSPRQNIMSPIERWEIYQIWLRNLVEFDPLTDHPRHPLQYKRFGVQTSNFIKPYFRTRYPEEFKFCLYNARQFYGDVYVHNAQSRADLLQLIETGDHFVRKDFVHKGIITKTIQGSYFGQIQSRAILQHFDAGLPSTLADGEIILNMLLRVKRQGHSIRDEIQSIVNKYYGFVASYGFTDILPVILNELITQPQYNDLITIPNAKILANWLHNRIRELISAKI